MPETQSSYACPACNELLRQDEGSEYGETVYMLWCNNAQCVLKPVTEQNAYGTSLEQAFQLLQRRVREAP